ncbi:MAG TPA: methylmalonyl Co-A mutase-associated GTPase MeaB [Peptococcaceae bacterium]|jgi:LAO/AO transport system kinase|nr:methylmalonyl Co-A mutase-associated GTPase MeaB [Clostridia bacterium]HOB82776.1 methylmalonyl Co-A mutase-associated GTPase MeaB [Peptococcaceae bacterium]HPZ71289.1 methylmalonyl Co-A mutase-associated GTPase MeaB [Peptococcaceae bacterium]HQD54762.1 methylmalonyl Co-A mutase-associated GTPase MeaB [Peptococcaceae bacterium]
MSMAEAVLQGEIRAISRLISKIENGEPDALEQLKQLYQHTGNAVVIGLTGAPGAGKSTLTNQLISNYLEKGFKVAVIAVDPSSVFTGGGVLGDRIRMPQVHKNLYIRSLATRGYLGGLSKAIGKTIKVLDAAGYQRIIIETVGTGQSEIEIRNFAQVVVVVNTPNMGDDIQTLKAGIMEIGDIYIVNKADLPEADRTVSDLIKMSQIVGPKHGGWMPPVLKVIAADGTGVPELVAEIEKYYLYASSAGVLSMNKLAMAKNELMEELKEAILAEALQKLQENGKWEECSSQVAKGELDPWTGAEHLLKCLKQ